MQKTKSPVGKGVDPERLKLNFNFNEPDLVQKPSIKPPTQDFSKSRNQEQNISKKTEPLIISGNSREKSPPKSSPTRFVSQQQQYVKQYAPVEKPSLLA